MFGRSILWTLVFFSAQAVAAPPAARPNVVKVKSDAEGQHLEVDGRPFMVLGMNWGYVPLGENYRYDLWSKDDAFIRRVLDRDMALLKGMGVNAIRLFSDIPPRWVTYIYEKYGIFTAVNHLAGRYGFLVDGVMRSPVDYSDPATRKAIVADIGATAARYKDVPGVLMYLIGNENNYGLTWKSFEIEALPPEEQGRAKADALYSLMGEAVAAIKKEDAGHPIALVNGDLGYIDLIAKYCKGMDIMGANVYRGVGAGDLYQKVREQLGVPFVYTEFGSDAFNARDGREDHLTQARVLRAQWQEIYEQSAGKGRVGNAIGGFIFQWTDGWWKYQQETNLSVQDSHASWPNGGYPDDFVEGENNMNEEWFGIAAIGKNDDSGMTPVYPRTAYYLLKQAFSLDPYAASTTLDKIQSHFARLDPDELSGRYERTQLTARTEMLERFSISEVRLRFDMITTGGSNLDDPAREETRFDHLESLYVGIGFKPYSRLVGSVTLNVLGNVPSNPIDSIFYENRGAVRTLVDTTDETFELTGIERVKIYQAKFDWDERWFGLTGYYRSGHYHWGYEGDFFGLYPEANYQPDVDRYNADAPFGFVFEGRRALEGFKLAMGPQLYWGANPQLIAKYRRTLSDGISMAVMHHEDFAPQASITSSGAIPAQQNRRSSIYLDFDFGSVRFEVGGLASGTNRIGDRFVSARSSDGGGYADSGYDFLVDEVQWFDVFGSKAKLSLDGGMVKGFVQGAYKGLVADGGPDGTTTYTGWSLKEDGRGNQFNVLTGLTVAVGDFTLAPGFLYQQPLEGPLPAVADFYNPGSGNYYPSISPRNYLSDPFAVLGNRETMGFEFIMAFDPTPGTWLWSWDNEIVEDATFAGSLDFTYLIRRGGRDVNIGYNEYGPFPFPGSPPNHDSWDLRARLLFRLPENVRLRALLYGGQGEARGDDARLVTRYGLDARLVWQQLAFDLGVRIDDWGPYDFHKDFNLTYPLQVLAELSYGIGAPQWLGILYSRVGARFQYRTLDEHSARFAADSGDPDARGSEWELNTYLDIGL